MNANPLTGIHHVTAITGNAQRNADFYAGVLGLRLVKKTVNFDDPTSYHLYYGDASGKPGTLITFFAWPEGVPSRSGSGEPIALAFEVPEKSLPWWREHLKAAGFQPSEGGSRFGAPVISVADPDGMRIELTGADVSRENAITRIHSVTLALRDSGASQGLYTSELGFGAAGVEDNRRRFAVGTESAASYVDVIESASSRGRMGPGTIHHIAFRTPDDRSQQEWLAKLTKLRLPVSPVMDRSYFHSIYFREPGGVLFEIATDSPGFAIDESSEHLGETLKLPAAYEPYRSELEGVLPPLALPNLTGAARI